VDRTNRNTALCSALVEELARSGVEHACLSPGSRSAPLARALWQEPGIRVWVHVDERCAGFFALGLAQQSGRPVAVLTTSGTAAANLFPAVAEASEARVPLIAITADRPPQLRGRGAGQTIDQIKLYGSAARWFCELGVQRADDGGLLHVRSIAARAVAEASGRPPGPVHLNVPLEEPLAPAPAEADVTAQDPLALSGRADGRPLTAVHAHSPSVSDELIASLARELAATPNGLIVAGRQRDASLAEPLTALARAAGYPLLAEPTSQLRCGPHDRELVVPHYDALLRAPPAQLTPELVIRFGDMPTSKALREWLARSGCRQLVVDPDGGWNEPTFTAAEIVRADPHRLATEIAELLPARPEVRWQERWRAASDAATLEIDRALAALGDELFEPRVYRELAPLLEGGSTVYVASSMPVRDVETFFPSLDTPLAFLANRGANGIDGLISSGLGAAAGSVGRTYLLVGDLGLYHDMNGLLAYRRLGVEATIVVLQNGGGAIFDFLPIARFRDGYEELFTTPTGLDLAKVADLYGLPFTRTGSYADLREAVASPGLVEVPLDRQRNVELHRQVLGGVEEAVRETLSGAGQRGQ
jgi:2-succinyl-5-enolpyruvyl-6-hydroxy-3-cyclohexene-1-carboxylate synthase